MEYTDPRISAFFVKNSEGKYVGSISGTNYPSTTSLTAWCRPVMAFNTPVSLLTVAEVNFFISEYYARSGNEVYANTPEVELLVNGRSVGSKKTDNCQAIFDVMLPEGESALSATGTLDGKTATDAMAITLSAIPDPSRDELDRKSVV